MYVGITRAQFSLHISYCERRKVAREFVPCEPSRFIDEMGKEDVRFSGGKQAFQRLQQLHCQIRRADLGRADGRRRRGKRARTADFCHGRVTPCQKAGFGGRSPACIMPPRSGWLYGQLAPV